MGNKVNLAMQNQFVEFAKKDGEGNDISEAIEALQQAISGVVAFDGELEVTFTSGSPVVSVPEGSSRVGIYKCKPTRSAIVSLYNWGPGWVGVIYAAFESNNIILYTGTTTAAYGTVTLTRRDEYMFNGKLNIGDYGQQTEYVEAPENGFNNNGIYVLENVAYNVRGLIVLGAGLGDYINYWGVFNGKVFSGIDQVKTSNIVIKDHLVTSGTKLYEHYIKVDCDELSSAAGGQPCELTLISDNPTPFTSLSSAIISQNILKVKLGSATSLVGYTKANIYAIGYNWGSNSWRLDAITKDSNNVVDFSSVTLTNVTFHSDTVTPL